MGQTPKPLTILIDTEIMDWAELLALQNQGHHVTIEPLGKYDVILSPRAHRMSESERPWLDDAIAEARRLKYPSKEPKNAA